jgi:hypothetical protein
MTSGEFSTRGCALVAGAAAVKFETTVAHGFARVRYFNPAGQEFDFARPPRAGYGMWYGDYQAGTQRRSFLLAQ